MRWENIGVGKSNKIELPKLPHGEGTMSWMPDGETIIYKKMVNKKRVIAYGKTVKEVLKNIKEKEEKAYNEQAEEKKNRELNKKKLENMVLKESITIWFYLYKIQIIKIYT